MEDEKEKETPPPILDQLKDYAETRIKLAKYQAVEGGTSILASLLADVVTIFCMVLAFIFASITLAFFLADKLGSLWEGFAIVAGIYLIIAIAIKINKKSLERPIINAFIQKIFK